MARTIIIDAHEDLAYNASILGRDYCRSAADTRRLERGSSIVEQRDNTMLGWPEYQRGNVALIFSTLFAIPSAHASDVSRKSSYRDPEEASRLCMEQFNHYRRLIKNNPEKFTMISNSTDLGKLLSAWCGPESEAEPPVGLVLLMEGAEGIKNPDELRRWSTRGLRAIGPAWADNRYCGGTGKPGPLTEAGRDLLGGMAALKFILDISHMDERAALESLDSYQGPIIASHSNAAAVIPGYTGNRHLSDAVIRGLIERHGVIGVVPCNEFLQTGWKKSDGRQGMGLGLLVDHIDHICQLAGNALHAGIGTDFDGGFGLESVPAELDSIADLPILAPMLAAKGYSPAEIEAVLGKNFLELLGRSLPP